MDLLNELLDERIVLFHCFGGTIRFMTIFVTYFAIFTTGCHQMLVPVGISYRSGGARGVVGYFFQQILPYY